MKDADLNRKDDLPAYLQRSDGRVQHVYDIPLDIFIKRTLTILRDAVLYEADQRSQHQGTRKRES
jgi:hypothetical protein